MMLRSNSANTPIWNIGRPVEPLLLQEKPE
jgi:hypothetical protein